MAGLHLSAEIAAHELHAVADAENRDAQFKKGLVARRRAGCKNARGPAGKNNALGVARGEVRRLGVEAEDFAIDLLFPHTPRDELSVLRAEVQDRYPFMIHRTAPSFGRNKVLG